MVRRYLSAVRLSLLSLSFLRSRKPRKIAFDRAFRPLVYGPRSLCFYGSEAEFSAFRPAHVLTAPASPVAILKMAA